jgi:translation initiation factor 4B
LPDKPPYTVHLGNLSFDATGGDVEDFFTGCECTNVRIIEDKLEMKPKGFGYAEFASLAGLKQALTLNGTQFQGRNIRISVADPRKFLNLLTCSSLILTLFLAKDRDRPDAREFGDWSRKGPLPDLPSRGGERSGRGGFGADFGGERRERTPYAGAEGDGKTRDFGNWERRGPLSPLPQQEQRGTSLRDGGRQVSRGNDGPKGEGFRDRHASPAAWGEGRPAAGSQDGGSRPPRREFQERPIVERAPTAAEQDNQWRTKMRPDAPPAKSPVTSREGSEAPSSPAPGSAAPTPAPAGRPRLNLAKRTVSEMPDQPSPTVSVSGDAKASPFGAARPIDTATKEREVEERRLAALKEKKEAEEKAKAEAKAAKEAAEAEKAEKAEAATATAAAEGDKKVEILQRGEGETAETENQNGEVVDDKAVKPKEIVRDARPKPADTGAWRRPSSGPPGPPQGRDDIPRGPRGGRGSRGGGRGPRHHDEGRGGRQVSNGRNAVTPASPAAQTQSPTAPEPEAAPLEEDGWSTVSKPKKNNNRGGNAGSRAIAS